MSLEESTRAAVRDACSQRLGLTREITVKIDTPIPQWEADRLMGAFKALAGLVVLDEFVKVSERKNP